MKFPSPEQDYTVLVVTLTYNHASFIEDTLKGIVMQKTNFPVVACVLDDCSTDGTADIVSRYEKQYPDLIKGFYFSENQYSQGRFTGYALEPWIKKAKYIAECEGDDYWTDPLKLQKQVDFLENHPECTLSFHNAIEHWEDGSRTDALFSNIENREYSGTEIYENWIVPTASCMIRASVFKNGINKIPKLKDFLFLDIVGFLCCGMCGKLCGMEDTMCIYRRNTNSLSLKVETDGHRLLEFKKKLCNHYRAMKNHFGSFYGKEFIDVSLKYYFDYNLDGLLLSLRMIDLRSYTYFLKQGLSESLILSLINQMKLMYWINRSLFTSILRKISFI